MMNLISIISAFFGITLIYTGFLALANHVATGLALSLAGFVLLVKPALVAARLLRGQSASAPRPGPRTAAHRKTRPKKVYLKVVKSEDDKPTIH